MSNPLLPSLVQEEQVYTNSSFPATMMISWINGVRNRKYQDIFQEALKSHQIASKLWMVQTMNQLQLGGDVGIFAGWCGISASMLYYLGEQRYTNIVTIDRNRGSSEAANFVCGSIKSIEVQTFDITKKGLCREVEIAINTSLEHFSDIGLADWLKTLSARFTLVVQSTNMPASGHISCSDTLEDLLLRVNLRNIMFKGSMLMNNGYLRHMVIGSL